MRFKDAKCVRELNTNFNFAYLVLWFCFTIWTVALALVILVHLRLLSGRKMRGQFINSGYYRETLSTEKLNLVCSFNVGAYFILKQFAKKMRPVHFDQMIDSLCIKIHSSNLILV